MYIIEELHGEQIVGTFYKKRIATNKSEFRVEKVIKGKGDQL